MRGRAGSAGRRPSAGDGGITLYDVLGVPAGASADTIRHACGERARQLRPGLEAGAPAPVVSAAARARKAVELASLVLGDPELRRRYDEATVPRHGRGLRGPSGFAEGALGDGGPYQFIRAATSLVDGDLGESFEALRAWTVPLPPPPPRHITTPDLRGLFYRPALAAATMAGFRLAAVRMTPDPLPVEGLVAGQSPAPGTPARRHAVLTVQVWHPARGG